ncbi:LysR family transcriptional regulator [Nocardioides sp.]|nr:LysR family transcriptional regulator [Nocardioides sp.]
MTPQQLRVLVGIRDHGSLSKAGSALGYGVPTIVHHLTALERHTKAQLVDRDRRGARLTPLGQVLVEEAAEILGRLERAERLLAAQRDTGLGLVRIGAFASVGSQLLPRAIRTLRSSRQVQVEVVEAEPTVVIAMLRAGELHAGLVYDSVDDPAFAGPGLDQTVIVEEPYQVLVSRESARAAGGGIDFASLADADWICSRDMNETSDRVLRRAAHEAGFEPRVLMRTDDLSMIHGLVAEGLGCTLMTKTAMDSRFAVTICHTREQLGLRRTSFVTPRGPVPDAVRELQGILTRLLPDRIAGRPVDGRRST